MATTREPGDLPGKQPEPAVGCDGKEDRMNAQTTTMTTATAAGLLPIAFAALIGLGIIVVTGHVQAQGLHDAAHDMRHATGFPCH
jgi:cobalt transporter subunit CbtB